MTATEFMKELSVFRDFYFPNDWSDRLNRIWTNFYSEILSGFDLMTMGREVLVRWALGSSRFIGTVTYTMRTAHHVLEVARSAHIVARIALQFYTYILSGFDLMTIGREVLVGWTPGQPTCARSAHCIHGCLCKRGG